MHTIKEKYYLKITNKNIAHFFMLVTQPSKITEKSGQRKRKNNPRPHVESNHDLAFRKRPFYPLNYRGGENLIMRKHNAD